MDIARSVFALLVIITYPPGVLLWLAIHPFSSFWRKLGPVWTYSLLGVPVGGMMVTMFLLRRRLLAVDFGTNPWLIFLAALCLIGAGFISKNRRKYLTSAILSGIPEISSKKYPGELLKKGIYAKIRHPRYVEVFFWTLGYALFANHLTSYLVILSSIPVISLVIFFEERELQRRFGSEYEEYCKKVPRFIPNLKRK